MITYSGRIHSYQLAQKLGTDFVIYCFGGQVPADLDSLPFDLYFESQAESIPNELERYTQLHGVNIYNNHLCHSFVEAIVPNDDNQWNQVEFVNSTLFDASLAKMSFWDVKENSYRHIPQKADSDLLIYDAYSSTDYLSDSSSFANIFWPTGNSDSWRVRIPVDLRSQGFFISADFEYEAAITRIKLTGTTSQAFSGDVDIYGWDDTLNEGQGDWVLHETHPVPDISVGTLVLAQELSTTKIKLQYGESYTTYNDFQTIEFFGAEPVEELPAMDTVTWALLVPYRPDSAMYDSTDPKTPVALLTAGGPSDLVEAKFNKALPAAGRPNSLISLNVKFISEEF